MQQLRELKLIGNSSELENFVERIETSLCDGWKKVENRKNSILVEHRFTQFSFVSPPTNTRPQGRLSLAFDDNGYLYVCNIVPLENGNLGIKNYNSILEEFLTKFVEPTAQDLGIKIETTAAERNIDNSMSPELSITLKRFLECANQSTGGSHPLDEKRFFDFIIQANSESSLLDESTLEGLLIDEGWSEDQADKLSRKYRFGKDLLKHFNS